MNKSVITASEIGEYAYCAKAWHLRRSGVAPRGAQLHEGTAFHEQHGEWTAQAAQWEGAARRLFGLAFLLLCLLVLYWLLNGGTR
ncbi:MAG: hypothetical protein HOP19_16205 [Acidobacteria bacterium]|nr:hypothetical protein [Acidobacteriota bacterium]